MRNLVFLIILVLSVTSNASRPAERFLDLIKPLEVALHSSRSPEKVAENLLSGGERVATFNLQSLGRLYKDRDPLFKSMRKDMKKLEDGIGEYKKYRDLLDAAEERRASRGQIAKLKRRKTEARAELAELLIEEEMAEKISDYREKIEDYDFPSYEKDKKANLNALQAQLNDVYRREWDLRYLEHGNGLHELRREVRWFVIQARSLGGMVTFKRNPYKCAMRSLSYLVDEPVAESKYASLDRNYAEENACKIDQCLFLGMVDAVNKLGDMKDEIEELLNIDNEADPDKLPKKYKKPAAKVLKKLTETNLIPKLAEQLKRCE